MQRLIDVSHLKGKARRAQIYNRVQNYNAYVVLVSDIDNAPTIDPTPKWIPVTERLPEPFVSVLVQMPGEKPFPTVREGFLSSNGIWHSALYDREPDEVTHWMPMPQPPEDGGAENE